MSRSPRKSANAVSLFPFLAVLICAMGTLIFLLIVTTQKIRNDALAKVEVVVPAEVIVEEIPIDVPEAEPLLVEQAAPEPLPEPVLPVIEETVLEAASDDAVAIDYRLDALVAERTRQAKSLADQAARRMAVLERRRRELQALERKLTAVPPDEQRQLSELKSLQQQTEQLEESLKLKQAELDSLRPLKQKDTETYRLLKTEQTVLRADVEAKTVQYQQLKQRQSGSEGKFAIVPYGGGSGTSHRPIMIECSAQGIRFLPENVTITADDVEGFSRNFNPLLAGAEALANYWTLKSVKANTEPAQPYVLLLVRPDGAVAFYAARKYLSSLHHNFGYELVEADWELDLPAVDQQARNDCQSAIARVLAKRSTVVDAFAEAQQGNNRGFVFGGGRNRIDEYRPRPGYEEPTETENGSSAFDRRNNPALKRLPNGDNNGPGFGNSEQRGRGTAEFSDAGPGTGNNPGTFGSANVGAPNLGERTTADSNGSYNTQEPGLFPPTNFPPGGFPQAGMSGSSPADARRQIGGEEGLPGDNEMTNNNGATWSKVPDGANNGESPGQSMVAERGNRNSVSGMNASPDNFGENRGENRSENSEFGEESSLTEAMQDVKSSTNSVEQRNGNQIVGEGTPANGSPQQPQPLAKFLQDRNGSGTGDSSSRSPSSGTPNQSGTPPSGMTAGSPASPADPNVQTPPAGPSFVMGSQQKSNNAKPVRSFADESLLNIWPQKKSPRSIGFERDVEIQINEDQIVVAGQTAIPLNKGEIDRAAIEQVVRGVGQQVATWGKAPNGFYWIPTIQFKTGSSPGKGLSQLERSLTNAGAQVLKSGPTSRVERITTTPPRRRNR